MATNTVDHMEGIEYAMLSTSTESPSTTLIDQTHTAVSSAHAIFTLHNPLSPTGSVSRHQETVQNNLRLIAAARSRESRSDPTFNASDAQEMLSRMAASTQQLSTALEVTRASFAVDGEVASSYNVEQYTERIAGVKKQVEKAREKEKALKLLEDMAKSGVADKIGSSSAVGTRTIPGILVKSRNGSVASVKRARFADDTKDAEIEPGQKQKRANADMGAGVV